MKVLVISYLLTLLCWAGYSPTTTPGKVSMHLTQFTYGKDKRAVPLRLYLPENKNAPVILLSHGLGGSRDIGAYVAKHWAARGFIVVAMQHHGSDNTIFKNVPKRERFKAMRKAISPGSFLARTRDVVATIDQITEWNKTKTHLLYQRFNLEQIGIGGHSYGAITSQAVAGQSFPKIGQKFTDKRIKAAFAMSPSSVRKNSTPEKNQFAFGKVKIPWLLMTGTRDKAIITPDVTVDDRKAVYANLPKGNKYQLVLHDATHMSFSDKTMIGKEHRNKNHHKAIQALSAAFFEAYLTDSKDAKTWLNSELARKVLQARDTWEHK